MENVQIFKYCSICGTGYYVVYNDDGGLYNGVLELGSGKVGGIERKYVSEIEWEDGNVPENSEEIELYIDSNLSELLLNCSKC